MTEVLEGQESMFDPDGWFGKTCPELSARTEAETSRPSSKKSSKSQNPPLPVCLCLKRDDGANPAASTMRWESGVWPGGYTMRSSTGFRNGEKEYRYWLTSEDLQRRGLCLTLNLSEKPRKVIHTKLSQILERNPDPKYNLSAKACLGILNRAAKRGKKLQEALEQALRAQANGTTPPFISDERRAELEAERLKALAELDAQEKEQLERYFRDSHNEESFGEFLERVERENPLYETLAHSIGDKGAGALSTLNIQHVLSLETYHCESETDTAMTLKARDYKDPQSVYCVQRGEDDGSE